MGIRRNQSVCYGKVCEAEVCGTDVCEDFIPFMCGNRMRATLISPTCKGVTFVGTEDVSIRQGIGINLLDGVYAYDEDGTELPVTVSPETINKCEVGNHEVVYTAIGAYLSRDKRNVTITQIDPPTISGMDTAHISVNTNFDPANGVSAVDDNGNTVPFEYSGEYYRDASGAIASFETLKQTSAVSVLTTIEPIQSGSGTPSPDNVRPISGHTECVTSVSGVNVWDEEWEVGYLTTDGQNTPNANRIRAKNYIGCKPNTQYYFKSTSYSSWYIVCFYNASKESVGYLTPNANSVFTTPLEAYYMRFALNDSYGTTYNNDISINYPSTDHEYHAYNGNTYTTALGRTVYGGTLDVVSGELVIDRAMVTFDGTEDWNAYGSGSASAFTMRIEMSNLARNNEAVTASNYLEPVPSNATWGNYDAFASSTLSQPWIVAGIKTITTVNDWKAYLAQNPLQICYELSTPQTYQLTPTEVQTLLGTNNLWTDCGSVIVTWEDNIPTGGAYQYPIKGTYQITYTAEDECGNETEVTRTIVVGD